jgi:hypothetical protein
LKKDSPRVQQLPFRILSQLVAPFCLRASLLHARAAALAMASLGHPDRFQSEEALNLVRDLLGWSASGLAGRIRAGAAPLGDLAAGEFVLFTSYISCGLALPISPFFLLLLEEFELQLQHLTPHSVLQAAIFVHLCEMFVGVAPCTSLFRYFFVLVKSEKTRYHIGAYYFQTRPDPTVVYIPTFGGARWENWRSDWVIASTEANDGVTLGLLQQVKGCTISNFLESRHIKVREIKITLIVYESFLIEPLYCFSKCVSILVQCC